MNKLIDKFIKEDLQTSCNISVVGDVMVDEYYDVEVTRISPEFPIPVMKSKHDRPKRVPGGAGNVACQFKHFNAYVHLTGIVGDIKNLLQTRKLFLHIPYECGLPIPVKKRFYQGDFPIARWDVEEDCYGFGVDSSIIGSRFENFELRGSDVTIFSDYNKGLFFTDWHKKYLSDRISIVDPKADLTRWHGCTILKPNGIEARLLTGMKYWKDQAQSLRMKTGCRDVVITQEGNGVVGLTPNGYFEHIATSHVTANSTVGAGDCFMAFLAMAVARGWSTEDAAQLAFEAGRIYVQSKHNRPLKPAEFISGRCGEKVVFTNGCFDILHAGHIQTLEFAKAQGDILVVGVNSDASVRKLKGDGRPVNNLADRIKMLSAMKCVDCVISFEEDTPIDLLRYVRPDIIVKGSDYLPEDVVGNEIAEVIIAPLVKGISTTGLISRISTIQ